jgi:NAD(P)-dependent dehydrogenase (short-subunit alcohol dehydrogenase family)
VESLAIETSPFGIQTTLLEPGSIASGALDNPIKYALESDPYAGNLATDHMDGSGALSVQEVARLIADAAQVEKAPLRLPLGDMASYVLQLRKGAPEDVPFVPGA